jgi:hypothetical protein
MNSNIKISNNTEVKLLFDIYIPGTTRGGRTDVESLNGVTIVQGRTNVRAFLCCKITDNL